MSPPSLLVLGAVGTRWLFGVVVASALAAWGSESWLGVIEPSDRIAYPLLASSFTALCWLTWRRPRRLRHWQRWGVTLMALYFTLSMLVFTLRPGPGPSLYALGSFAPWTLAGSLLLFTTWRAAQALRIALAQLALMMAPPTLLRFVGQPPPWLLEAWPLLANLALCQTMFCVALWGLSRQVATLVQAGPAGTGLVTVDEIVKARVAELEHSQAAAEAAARAKSEFLASVGHEIRTPMNTVVGQARLLLAGSLSPEQRQQLQEITRAGESLVKLIDGLLDYSDLDAGRMPLASDTLRLEALIGSAVDAVRPAAQARQLELLCDISPELLGRDGMRRGDPQRITQLITELLVNAVKFTAAGEVRLGATLGGDGAWLLQVRDSGVGLTPAQLARLFTPLAQAEAHASRRFGGTGLGLAICRALAERMGGTLTARSTPGCGSEFSLRLPLPAAPELPLPAAPGLGSILIVQAAQSPGHRGLVSLVQALAPSARVDVLNQGHQALALLQSPLMPRLHDLMLVDWVLPDMDATTLLRELATTGLPEMRRVVLLSAFDTPALRERALRDGAHALLARPVLPHTLRQLLELDRPLQITPPQRAPAAPGSPRPDAATLAGQLDQLLAEADSDALTLWEQHGSAVLDLLPPSQAKAMAGAMQRLDFDAARAALREGHRP